MASARYRIMQSIFEIFCKASYINLRKIFSEGPVLSKSCKDTQRILRQDLLTKACTRSCKTAFHRDLHKIFSEVPVQERIPPRSSKISTRSSHEDNRFVRSCAVEMHVDISQEPFYVRIYWKNAGSQMDHPDQAPAFTPTVRTPQCGHTVWGIIIIIII